MLRNRVAEFRELYGYSEQDLAERAGISLRTIRFLESNPGWDVRLSTAERICRVFNLLALERMFWIDYRLVDLGQVS